MFCQPNQYSTIHSVLQAGRNEIKKFYSMYRTEFSIFSVVFVAHIMIFFGLLYYPPVNANGPFPVWGDGPDQRGYFLLATNLIKYQKFTVFDKVPTDNNAIFPTFNKVPFEPDSFRTPVFPLFIAVILLIFQSIYAISIVHAILIGMTSVFIYKIGKNFFSLSNWHSMAAGLLFGLEPAGIVMSEFATTEVLFQFLLIILIYLILKLERDHVSLWSFATIGLLIGIITLTRPIAQYWIFPFLALFICFYRKINLSDRLRATGVIFIFFIIAISPWAIRNKIIFNQFGISSLKENNLYLINLKRFYMYKTGIPERTANELFTEKFTKVTGNDNIYAPTFDNSHFFVNEFMSYFKTDPIGYIKFHMLNVATLFLTDGLRDVGQSIKALPKGSLNLRPIFINPDMQEFMKIISSGGIMVTLFLIGFVFWSLINILMLIGIITGIYKKETRYKSLLLSGTIFYMMTLSGIVGTPRFRFAISSLMFIMAIYGLSSLIIFVKNKKLLVAGNYNVYENR